MQGRPATDRLAPSSGLMLDGGPRWGTSQPLHPQRSTSGLKGQSEGDSRGYDPDPQGRVEPERKMPLGKAGFPEGAWMLPAPGGLRTRPTTSWPGPKGPRPSGRGTWKQFLCFVGRCWSRFDAEDISKSFRLALSLPTPNSPRQRPGGNRTAFRLGVWERGPYC